MHAGQHYRAMSFDASMGRDDVLPSRLGVGAARQVGAAGQDRADTRSLRAVEFRALKRTVDAAFVLTGLVPLLLLIVLVWVLNFLLNPGPLFFTQVRMGRNCKPFTVVKFRTMRPVRETPRGPDDPLEVNRIPAFGGWLRRTRLDELPQLLNVARGEMSLVGPRPDSYSHATAYGESIPGYEERHVVPPGITGLAQTTLGYAEGVEATRRKVEADLFYIRNMSVALEFSILYRTVCVIVSGRGAR